MNKRLITAVCSLMAVTMISAISASAESDVVLGDVNGDGVVNVTDTSLLAAHAKGVKALQGDALKAADVNNDGIVNITDISLVAANVKGVKNLNGESGKTPDSTESSSSVSQPTDEEMIANGWHYQGEYNGVDVWTKPNSGLDINEAHKTFEIWYGDPWGRGKDVYYKYFPLTNELASLGTNPAGIENYEIHYGVPF